MLDTEEGGDRIFLYGEPWSAGASPMAAGKRPADKRSMKELEGIAVFNDDTRDAVKGPYDQLEVPGFVNGKPGQEDKIRRAVRGLFRGEECVQPLTPAQVLNYVSAHDNSTLWDKLVDSVKKNRDYDTMHEDLLAMNRLAAAIVQLSAGIPFMQAGEEAGRTKQGEDNSYNLSKELNRLDWERMYRFEKLTDFYRGLHAVRNSFSGFYDLDSGVRSRPVFLEDAPAGMVAYTMDGNQTDPWEKVTVVFYAGRESIPFALGEGIYKIVVMHDTADVCGCGSASGIVEIPGISAFVFVQDKVS